LINDWFYRTARDFHWEMREPLTNGHMLYARYAFSYVSTIPKFLDGRRAQGQKLHSEHPSLSRSELQSPAAPIERAAMFDEAQRAWDKDKAANFMAQRKGVPNFDQSEPEFLISVMDRHADWCTIVCLIGGGQEPVKPA
jgi:hypothetical protein